MGDRHWSKINLPDWPWLPRRGTPGHLLLVLAIWCVLGFLSGAGFTLLYLVLEIEGAIHWRWPPTPALPWVRWVVLGGGIIGAGIATYRGWKQYPKDLN